jgi:hypothetical protein
MAVVVPVELGLVVAVSKSGADLRHHEPASLGSHPGALAF